MVLNNMTLLRVRLTPRAARTEITGWRDDVLLARVTAPPVQGRANEALIRLLAAALAVPPSRLEVVAGAASRDKTLRVLGLSQEEVRARLSTQQ